MRFSLTKQQEMLRKSFAEFLSAKCKLEDRHEWLASEGGFSIKIWREIAELGWPCLIIDEQYGGMGGTFMEAFILFEELGKYLFTGPLFASAILSGGLIDTAGSPAQKEEHLTAISDSKRIYTTALLDESGRIDFEKPAVTAVRRGSDGFQLNGTLLLVPYAHVADAIVVCANVLNDAGSGPTLFMINKGNEGMELAPVRTLNGEKEFAVRFKESPASHRDILGELGQGHTYIKRLWPKAVMLKCAEMIGGMKKVLELTVDYAKARHQFSRPLGSFQAIQHQCADMASDLEVGRLLAYSAAALIDENRSCDKEVAMAKAWCSDTYPRCCERSHQIHGAYGVTEECSLHLYTKHAKTAELMFGHSWFYRSRVGHAMGLRGFSDRDNWHP